MNPAQRILLAARLWLHYTENSSMNGAEDAPGAIEAVKKEIEQSLNSKETINHINTPYHQPSKHDPHHHASIDKDNQIIMDALTKAKKVAVMLGHAGHHVLDISIGSHNARLTIGASNRCNLLGGTMIKIIRMNGVEEKTMAANIEGVQVEWTTTSKLSSAFNK